LTDPQDYDGGELVIIDGDNQSRVKLPAGSTIVYPTTSLHRVEEITRGSRWACFFCPPSQLPLSDGGGVRLFLARSSLVEEEDWPDMLQEGDVAQRVQQMVQKGSAKAMCAWGKMLLGGHGVTQDEVQAIDWFKQAAAQNYVPAINLLGRCYEHGWGVENNMMVAVLYYERAAIMGET